MEKAKVDLTNLLTRISEEKINIAGRNEMQEGQPAWGWSASENKSWSWSGQSWQK
jgi:hypothetical protein